MRHAFRKAFLHIASGWGLAALTLVGCSGTSDDCTTRPPSCTSVNNQEMPAPAAGTASSDCQWRLTAGPRPDVNIRTAGGTSSVNFWIAGDKALFRWGGEGWQDRYEAALGIVLEVFVDEDRLWVINGGPHPNLHHFDGNKWSAIPAADGVRVHAQGVFGTGPNDIIVALDTGYVHWNGTRWTAHTDSIYYTSTTNRGNFNRVKDEIWTLDMKSKNVLRIRNGEVSVVRSVPAAGVCLQALWVGSESDIWISTCSGNFEFLHWDGQAWEHVPNGSGHITLTMDGADGQVMWAAGHNGTLLRWKDNRWTPVPSGTTQHIRHLISFGRSSAWAVGAGNEVVNGQSHADLLRCD